MPELPEVETVRRGLERTLLGKTIQAVEIRVKKLFLDDLSLINLYLRGSSIQAVKRRAKVLLLELSSDWVLAIHLKMTGQLIVGKRKTQSGKRNSNTLYPSPLALHDPVSFVGGHPEKVYEQPLPHKHTHVIIGFTDGTRLYFNDLRKFGWMRLLPKFKRQNAKIKITKQKAKLPTASEFLQSLALGPEPLGADFTLEYLVDLLKKRSIPIKQILLEQKSIAGIGNIYADEALFYAGIHPQKKANSLKRVQIGKLYDGIRHVLELGIEHGGTTMNSYRTVDGAQGRMREHLKVYGRTGDACFVCGTLIERIKIGQRSSHYCPKCQRK